MPEDKKIESNNDYSGFDDVNEGEDFDDDFEDDNDREDMD